MSEFVLIIEDEHDLAFSIAYNLRLEGYQTQIASTGAAGLESVLDAPAPDLILLDLMLPDISGIEVCRRIRNQDQISHIPIIMVTAKCEEIDRVVGFEVGADDYVIKPFSIRELMLRVRAVLRRRREAGVVSKEVISWGPFRVDNVTHRAYLDGIPLVLTVLEFRLLHYFMQNRNKVLTRESLLTQVWEVSPDLSTRTVDKHVQRLRQKLGGHAHYIETIRGVGYACCRETQS